MIRSASLGWLLWTFAAALVALTAVGAVAQWRAEHATVGLVALIQAPIYAATVWIAIIRPDALKGDRAIAGTLLVGAVMRLMIVAAPPVSSDIYRYIWDGRIQAAGINPYRYVPADEALRTFRDEAIYPSINRADYAPTIYPPAAQIVFLAVTRISETPAVMKAAMLLFEALAVWAMLLLLTGHGIAKGRILVYVWHPLPLWEFAGSGHVDIVAIAFLLFAFVAVDHRWPILAGVALAAGTLVKFFPILAAPAVCARWNWRVPIGFVVGTAILYLPYLGAGSQIFGFLGGYVSEEGFASGSGIFLWSALTAIVPLPSGASIFYLSFVAVILIALALALFLRRQQSRSDLLAATVLVFAALVLLSPHYPWYFTWLVPFLCFYPFAGGIYLTSAATYLHLGHWPPTLLEGALIYGGSFAALAIEFGYRRYSKGEVRGNTVAT